ncbi:hypothetical protein [Chromobacterium vaccinii]|uniref:hypothetical protein n=1 Tax=Chromobacterium vaccinii TaxID=1108595 RepID=UPI001E36EBDD|nr:hypothetical protein [Chromobacterium vaccinii]MCD4501996.1 hypothetical protein [Chromobacterium vaccinii]
MQLFSSNDHSLIITRASLWQLGSVLLLSFLFPISNSAVAAGQIRYCNGMFSFISIKPLDNDFIQSQSAQSNCRNKLKIKLKNGKKIVKLNFPSESYQLDSTQPTITELNDTKGESTKIIYQSYLVRNSTGDVRIDTFINQNKEGGVDSIEKDFYFSKKDVYSVYAAYKAKPNDLDDMTMLNALEQFFLSLKVDWN